jgi:hypothetical protein
MLPVGRQDVLVLASKTLVSLVVAAVSHCEITRGDIWMVLSLTYICPRTGVKFAGGEALSSKLEGTNMSGNSKT